MLLNEDEIKGIRDYIIRAKRNLGNIFTGGGNVAPYGCTDGRYAYVKYAPGKHTYFPYTESQYGVSDGFTGCIFAKYKKGNEWRIAHLANDTIIKWTDLWNDYVRDEGNQIGEYKLFYPGGEILYDKAYAFKETHNNRAVTANAIGVIYQDRCYSLFYDANDFHIFYQIEWNTMMDSNRDNVNIGKANQQILEERTLDIVSITPSTTNIPTINTSSSLFDCCRIV